MRGWIAFYDGRYVLNPRLKDEVPWRDEVRIAWWQWALLRLFWRLEAIEQRWLRRLDERNSTD